MVREEHDQIIDYFGAGATRFVSYPKEHNACVCVCICDPLCEMQAKVSKSDYEITSIKVGFQPLISL